MKKLILGATFLLFMPAFSVSAHELFVNGKNDGEVFKAEIVYGHYFPEPEEIPEEREGMFLPVQVIGSDGVQDLVQKGEETYQYEGNKPLEDGTYLLYSATKPTSWVVYTDRSKEINKTRKDAQGDVRLCITKTMYGKRILSVGEDDGAFATTPIGRGVEITPLVKASEIRENEVVAFRLTKDGKPLKTTEVFGGFADYTPKGMSLPFYATTNLEGIFEFRPLKKGLWYLRTELKGDSGNADCESYHTQATLTFEVR